MAALLQALPDGPLDIVGDVHGELDALKARVHRLGGDADAGRLARPLVFVGDRVDRGPDSPGVVRLVRRLVEAGQAFCVLGNHELNLLQRQRKEGNGWFFSDSDDGYQWADEAGQGHDMDFESVVLQPSEAEELGGFLATLPLALHGPDLRVVHACWHEPSIAALPGEAAVGELANAAEAQVDTRLRAEGILQAAEAERAPWFGLRDPGARPDRHLPHEQARNARRQRLLCRLQRGAALPPARPRWSRPAGLHRRPGGPALARARPRLRRPGRGAPDPGPRPGLSRLGSR